MCSWSAIFCDLRSFFLLSIPQIGGYHKNILVNCLMKIQWYMKIIQVTYNTAHNTYPHHSSSFHIIPHLCLPSASHKNQPLFQRFPGADGGPRGYGLHPAALPGLRVPASLHGWPCACRGHHLPLWRCRTPRCSGGALNMFKGAPLQYERMAIEWVFGWVFNGRTCLSLIFDSFEWHWNSFQSVCDGFNCFLMVYGF